jgi:hypothetical protein
MNKIVIPPTGGAVDKPRRLDIGAMMEQALQPFRIAKDLSDAMYRASAERDLVARSPEGRLIALDTTDPAARWQLYCRAQDALDELPPLASIKEAYHTVNNSIITAPTEKQKIALIGVMLGGCGIRSTPDVDSYISALSWMLDDCPINRDIELYLGRKRWMPLPAIAATVRKVWTNRREDYGRPIPIAEFIDECGRHSSLLLYERSRIETFGRTHCSLSAIVKATEDAEPPDDDEAVPL